MSDYKTSLLVNRQVPEFVREEYPLFISFLEAYYEFLETKQGNELNDLTTKAKDFRNLTDVDESIDEFEKSWQEQQKEISGSSLYCIACKLHNFVNLFL